MTKNEWLAVLSTSDSPQFVVGQVMNKNEWLAVSLLGLTVKPSGAIVFADGEHSGMNVSNIHVPDRWNPEKDIAQAFMLLEMFDDIRIMKEFNAADLCIWGVELKGKADCVFRKTLPEAITEAVLQASGYYETTAEKKDG